MGVGGQCWQRNFKCKSPGAWVNMGLIHRRISSLRWSCEVAVGHDVKSEYNGHYMPAKKLQNFILERIFLLPLAHLD